MLQIQRMHMAGGREQPYSDIGYNLGSCPHRRILIGRGAGILPAANGAGLNSGHYAVLAFVGFSDFTVPNDDLLHAVLDAVDYLREHGGAGREIRGHRDDYATSCPGHHHYGWIRRGAPRPTAASPLRLPELRPGDRSEHVVTIRRALGTADQTSSLYTPEDPDLMALVVAFKTRHKLGADLVWTSACWKILDHLEKPERKITLYSRSGVDSLVKSLKGFELTFDGTTATCKHNGANAAGLPRYACTEVTPSPTPTPTS
ncbi:hypothetical protein ACFWY5_31950 [Nonomuraea sp. NPDC059007]|uniref:hypothetical protein n=1 Tax=Nonomuraea sp. NPDC059007 TaxID=3346692 RepID=UPI00368704B4